MSTEPRAWHAVSAEEALRTLGSGAQGLGTVEAARRLAEQGPNVLPRGKVEGPLRVFLRQVNDPLIGVLLGSGILAVLMGKATDAAAVFAVVVVNAVIGFFQEWRAGKALAALEGLVPDLATVVRDGERHQVPAVDLVLGDVVALQSGDKVPADLRLLTLRNLQVTEAALTGESVPTVKDAKAVAEDASLGDRLDMAFSGTLVASGAAEGVVIATGAATELGRISALLESAEKIDSPLTRSLARFGRVLTLAIVGVAAALLGVGLLRGYPLADAVLAAVTLAVAAIPEGLPAIITITLAIGVRRMAKRRAVVRRLPSVETLGSTTVICSDKTGTLTRNEMTVTHLWTPRGSFELTGAGYAPEGFLVKEGKTLTAAPAEVRRLLAAGALCNDAVVRLDGGRWGLSGDPTEGAIVVAAAKIGLGAEALRTVTPRADVVPFESENQLMATFHEAWEGGPAILVKGAPEAVVRASSRVDGGATVPLADVLAAASGLAQGGRRVLAIAVKRGAPSGETLTLGDATEGLELLGLVAMIDPPRPEAIEAISVCHRAGITVKMITGDHPETAAAIGRQLGLLAEGTAVSGRELDRTTDDAFPALASTRNVFARVSPEQKLRLVKALQGSGTVVAMTGDGVNDAPALKQSDIGVAMGVTGTAVSKEAADIVLLDDNFASIAAAVEEGRRVWDNLVKALAFALPTNLGEALLILVAVAFFPIQGGQPLLPVLPVQILWINLVATVTLALPLAFEAKEPDVMRRKPREAGMPLLGPFVIFRTVLVALLMAASAIGLFLHELHRNLERGEAPAWATSQAQTMAVTSLVLFQVFYLLTCRSLKEPFFRIGLFSNPAVWPGILGLLGLQAAFVHLPALNRLFGSGPLDPVEWVKSALTAAVILPVVALEKAIRKRKS